MSTADPEINPSPARLDRSTAGALRRLRILCVLIVIMFYVVVGFAWIWPQDLTAAGRSRVLVDHVAFMLRTFTFHGGLALLATALFALVIRGRRIALLAVPGVIVALYPTLPLRSGAPSLSAARAASNHTPTLTLMSANLLYINTDAKDLVAQIDAIDPEVIVFQECTPRWEKALKAALSEQYPYSISIAQDDCFGQAVYSRLPFAQQPRLYPPNAPGDSYSWSTPEIRVVVELDGRPIAIDNIHLLPPAAMSYVREQRAQTVALAGALSHESMPYVMAGDFNFSPSSAHHNALIDAGARSAWDTCGSGRGATWPRTGWLTHVPGIRLDQIFYSPRLECVGTGVGNDFGSDHAPVWATFQWTKNIAPMSVR